MNLLTPFSWASEGSIQRSFVDRLGINYFTFFNGPGLHPDHLEFNPNQMGNPGNDGINAQTQISVRYKFSDALALDFQSRFYVIFNNYTENEKFSPFRWETPRIGVSGLLLSGSDWTLAGAINTDFPHFFPTPLSGYQAKQRTVIFNPGLFAKFNYAPKNSRWSVFSVVSPRYFFYADREAAEVQLTNAGFDPGSKPELILALKPTLNYSLSEKLSLSTGTSIDYRKQVMSSWNILDATLVTNEATQAWVLDAVPLTLGVTYAVSPTITIFPYVSTFPIAVQRIDRKSGTQASLFESASIGMWINGTIL